MRDLLIVIAIAIVAVVGTARSSIFNPDNSVVRNADSKDFIVNGGGLVAEKKTGSATSSPRSASAVIKASPVASTTKKSSATTTPSVVKPSIPQPLVVTPTKPIVVTSVSFPLDMKDAPAGVTVTVPNVTFAEAGWVAVQDQNAEGNGFGNTMGATWLPKGSHKNVVVELLRPTITGKLYFVVLHSDDGDKKYDHVKDGILKTAKGESVAFGFHALAAQ